MSDDESGEVAPGAARPAPRLELDSKKRAICAITGTETNRKNLVPLATLRPALADHIRIDFPELDDDSLISTKALAKYRTRYVSELLREEHGEYSDLDRQVVESIAAQDTIAENVEDDFDEHRTLGERLSDGLASFGGSWAFLTSFGGVLLVWIVINVIMGDSKAFDPYPFILLNLVLSCIAAVQAPIIMMSQKRQEEKDRLRSFNDYRVNLKAELEIRHLHEKMDHLITRQWQRLAEIQQIQLEMMTEARPRVTVKRSVKKKTAASKKRGAPPAPPTEPTSAFAGDAATPDPLAPSKD